MIGPNTITIAAGTPDAIDVVDLRKEAHWSTPSGGVPVDLERRLIVHHTAVSTRAETTLGQWEYLCDLRRGGRYGLAYNFVAFPDGKVWYVNDIDNAWPHTYNANGACAVAGAGNFQEGRTGTSLPDAIRHLAAALGSMWGQNVPMIAHKNVPFGTATVCPGTGLLEALNL